MIVYIVICCYDESSDVYAIFLDEDKAEAYCEDMNDRAKEGYSYYVSKHETAD